MPSVSSLLPSKDVSSTAELRDVVTSKDIIAEAERTGMFYDGLWYNLQNAYNNAPDLAELDIDYPIQEGLEGRLSSLSDFLDACFIHVQKKLNPQARPLKEVFKDADIYHPQSVINEILTGNVTYFKSDGTSTDFEGYLNDYYRTNGIEGLSISIKQGDCADFLDSRNLNEYESSVLATLVTEGVPVTILVLKYKGQTKEIPIIFSYATLRKFGARAMYVYSRSNALVSDEVILANPLVPEGTYLQRISSLTHEIDHAVFTLLHPFTYKKGSEPTFNISREKHDLKSGVAWRLLYEGFARRAQYHFLDTQAEGIASSFKHSDLKDAVVNSARLLELVNRAEYQSDLGAILYLVGDMLLPWFCERLNLGSLYTSDILEETVVQNPDLIKELMRHIISHVPAIIEQVNSLRTYKIPIPSDRERKALVRKALGEYAMPFVLGDEYFVLLEDLSQFVEGLSEEELRDRVARISKSDPKTMQYLKDWYGEDHKALLLGWEVIRGRLRQRFNEEFNKLFQS